MTLKYTELCDFSKLTLLVYEYGKTFTLDKNMTLNNFIEDIDNNNKIDNMYRYNIIKELSKSSPLGKVYKFYSVNSTDLQVGITLSKVHKRICVVFRGSESKYDWYYDLKFTKIKLNDGIYVHSGFYEQLHKENMFNNLKNDLIELLKEYADYDLFITGHSLGAALSTLFGYELSKIINNFITIVSFASPRVGNSEFKKDFDLIPNLKHYRITNDRDIVTAVPMLDYHHVGINICLFKNGYNLHYDYDYNLLKFSLLNCWRISDHSMDIYNERIVKNFNKIEF